MVKTVCVVPALNSSLDTKSSLILLQELLYISSCYWLPFLLRLYDLTTLIKERLAQKKKKKKNFYIKKKKIKLIPVNCPRDDLWTQWYCENIWFYRK